MSNEKELLGLKRDLDEALIDRSILYRERRKASGYDITCYALAIDNQDRIIKQIKAEIALLEKEG